MSISFPSFFSYKKHFVFSLTTLISVASDKCRKIEMKTFNSEFTEQMRDPIEECVKSLIDLFREKSEFGERNRMKNEIFAKWKTKPPIKLLFDVSLILIERIVQSALHICTRTFLLSVFYSFFFGMLNELTQRPTSNVLFLPCWNLRWNYFYVNLIHHSAIAQMNLENWKWWRRSKLKSMKISIKMDRTIVEAFQ